MTKLTDDIRDFANSPNKTTALSRVTIGVHSRTRNYDKYVWKEAIRSGTTIPGQTDRPLTLLYLVPILSDISLEWPKKNRTLCHVHDAIGQGTRHAQLKLIPFIRLWKRHAQYLGSLTFKTCSVLKNIMLWTITFCFQIKIRARSWTERQLVEWAWLRINPLKLGGNCMQARVNSTKPASCSRYVFTSAIWLLKRTAILRAR
jgi:hypothetical protein